MPVMSIVLGIDTSTTACSAALLRDGEPVAFRFEAMERGQAERLNPMVAEVLAEAGVTFADLTLLAVTTGPGAFTGLRIGLACARAVALAAGTPLAGVTTFDALARAVPAAERDGRDIVVCVNGKRRDVFVQRFDARLRPIGVPGALAPEGAAAALADGAILLAGDGAAQLRGSLEATDEAGDGPTARLRFSTACLPPDARHVAALGLAAGASALPPRPFYIRPPDARLPGGA
jgi:tRNA threonylcarbamoyladenosine biosynthesis protein TsaB